MYSTIWRAGQLTPYLDELSVLTRSVMAVRPVSGTPVRVAGAWLETARLKRRSDGRGRASGNRNFEGRIHPLVKTNWLASPPLVVAYALAGNMNINSATDPLGYDQRRSGMYLKDIWPSAQESSAPLNWYHRDMFRKEYAEVLLRIGNDSG